MKRLLLSLFAVLLFPVAGWGQATVLQGGTWQPGLVPMYSSSGGTQPVVQNSGRAGGGAAGVGISELNITARGTGTAPYIGQGSGQGGTVFQIQDAPTTNAAGYHALSFSANVNNGGLISYNAYGGAAQIPLRLSVNGSTYDFPFVLQGIIGPATSTIGHIATWANTTGTLLADGGALDASAITYSPSPPGAVNETVQTALRRQFYVDQYGPPKNFTQTDSTAIINAITAATNAGGGTVLVGPSSYWSTLDITVPRGVTLECVGYAGKLTTGLDFQNKPCSIYFASGKSLFLNGELREVNIFNDIVHFTTPGTTSRVDMQNYIDSFSGRGIVLGNGVGNAANNATVKNVMVGGFATCIEIDNSQQIILNDILMDCTNGVDIRQSFDDNRLRNVQLWEFLTTNRPQTLDVWTINGIADDGAGGIRLTLSTASDIQTGEILWVGLGTGGQGSAGQWTVSVVDPTHIDLQGSIFAPAATGDTTDGSTYIPVDSTAGLQAGMTVTGAGIPVGATIGAVWQSRSAISLNQAAPATATATGVALTFASTAYTPNSAQLSSDGTYRNGIGFRLGRADGTTCEGCFVFGSKIGFRFEGAIGLSFVNTQYDSFSHAANQNVVPIALEFTGVQTYGNYISGSLLTTAGVNIMSRPTNGAGSYANRIDGMRIASAYNNSTALEVSSGAVILSGVSDGAVHAILIDNSAQAPVMTANALTGTSIFATTQLPIWEATNRFGGARLDQRVPSTFSATAINSMAPQAPRMNLYAGLAAVDTKFWSHTTSSTSGQYCLQTLNDAFTIAGNAMCIQRTGNVPTMPTILPNTAIGAGANTQAFLKASSTANFGLYYGTGDPSFSAARGSLYMKTDAASTVTRLWVNTDGGTTWAFFTSST